MSPLGTYCVLKVSKILKQKPELEKTFDWLKNKKPLYLDSYYPNLKLAIEFDGAFHFEEYKKYYKTAKYEQKQINDALKDKLCAEHGIKIIRIPYTQSLATPNLINFLKQNNINI